MAWLNNNNNNNNNNNVTPAKAEIPVSMIEWQQVTKINID